MKVDIIPMTEAHVIPCAKILSSTPLWVTSYGVTYQSALRTFRVGLADPQQTLCVAMNADEVVGLAYYGERGAFYFGSYLRLLAVHEAYRGQQIGGQLLAYVEDHVKTITPSLFLLATSKNTDAHRFYERHGYTHVGALPDYVIQGITEFIFWKKLT